MASVLGHTLVSETPSPAQVAVVLHGILGQGTNFRGFAKRLAEAHRAWGFLLVDLPGHGPNATKSTARTIAEVVAEVSALVDETRLPVTAILGHSFGGKIATLLADARADTTSHLFVLDSSPGAHPEMLEDQRKGATAQILRMLEAMPEPFASRESFIADVLAEGHSRDIAAWLAMNVRVAPDGHRLRLDLAQIRALLTDYVATNTWPALARVAASAKVVVVRGGKSKSIPDDDIARFESLAKTSSLRLEVLPNAGHWLQVDDPDGLFAIVSNAL